MYFASALYLVWNVYLMLGCLCCQSGPLHLSANLDRSAYCPGEFILITANLVNNTSRDMDHLCVELIQKVEYKAKREDGGVFWETKSSRDEVAQVKSM